MILDMSSNIFEDNHDGWVSFTLSGGGSGNPKIILIVMSAIGKT